MKEVVKMYYDGTKILSKMDVNGNKPELYLVTTNRTGGKTTWFSRYLVNRFLKYGEKFCLLYRYSYELSDVSEKFFKDIQGLFFPNYNMTDKSRCKGAFKELFLNDKPCGYAVAINGAENIKKYSHFFSDVVTCLLDEFQSETNKYVPNELQKFQSIHTSIARGQGKQVRYVPVILLGNAVTLLNPYYTALGISTRLKSDTKFLRGDGYILESGFIDSASRAQNESAFNRAFAVSEYAKYASENTYLNDNTAFIEKPKGKGKYLCTFVFEKNSYAIREYMEDGIIYVDTRVDKSFPLRISATTADHRINFVMLKNNEFMLQNFRYFFENGCFRFSNLESKNATMNLLSF
jgi:hypothetical protein